MTQILQNKLKSSVLCSKTNRICDVVLVRGHQSKITLQASNTDRAGPARSVYVHGNHHVAGFSQ